MARRNVHFGTNDGPVQVALEPDARFQVDGLPADWKALVDMIMDEPRSPPCGISNSPGRVSRGSEECFLEVDWAGCFLLSEPTSALLSFPLRYSLSGVLGMVS